jgi:hypothetical protein
VLCAPEDRSALWAAGALGAHGLPVRVVTTEELVYSTSVTHTVGAGPVTTAVRLRDGGVLGPDLLGTLNRVSRIPTDHLAGASSLDRDYAVQELHALLTSVLHGLPGQVLGRPDARGLCGAWWRPAEWMVAAGRAGLRGVGHRSGAADPLPAGRRMTVLVIGGRVVGSGPADALPEAVQGACVILAAGHGSGLLGIDLVHDGRGWLFAGATPLPDLSAGGAAGVEAMVATLSAGQIVPSAATA